MDVLRLAKQLGRTADRLRILAESGFKVMRLSLCQPLRQRVAGIAFDQSPCAGSQGFGSRAHPADEHLAQLAPSGVAKLLREANQCGRLNAGPFGDLAHGGNGYLVRIIEQECRSLLKLRAEVWEAFADKRSKGVEVGIHGVRVSN